MATRRQDVYQKTFPTDARGNRYVLNDMGKYIENIPVAPEDIAQRKAYFVGAGIGNLIAAGFLIRDGQLPPENITFLEAGRANGGSFDGAGNNEDGFITRGGREMGQHFECFWDIMKDVPAIEMDAPHTVLDEFRLTNESDPNLSNCRIIRDRAQVRLKNPEMGLSKRSQLEVVKLFLAREEDTYGKTIEDWFGEDFMKSNFYTLWASMFAFQDYQSLTEMKRYMHRFVQYLPGFPDMSCLRFSKYNQYTSFIEPLEKKLRDQGVNFRGGVLVTDLDVEYRSGTKNTPGATFAVTAIKATVDGKEETIDVDDRDLVIVTNGSLTDCSGYGDMNTVPPFHKDKLGDSFALWKNIAAKIPGAGRPEVFCSDPDKTVWESISFNFFGGYDNPFNAKLRELSTNDVFSGKTVTGGVITAQDSPWLASITVNRQPQFPGQEDGLCVAWAYGLHPWEKGTVTGKPMLECTGEEILREFCYHFGIADSDVATVIAKSKVRLATMPYITSQFQPRTAGDRPWPVPDGSLNLGFTGQFVETPDDCVFTTEGSARTGQMAVYGLLKLDRDIPPIYPVQYDIRALLHSAKALGDGHLPGEKLLRRLLRNTYYENLLPQ